VVFQFLDGGAPHTAAVAVAKGVIEGMAKIKVSVAMTTVAAILVCLGISAAQPEPPRPLAIPALGETPLKLDPTVPSVAAAPADVRRETVHRSANFVVSAPTPVTAR
jgi:hypothetical protein